MPYTFDFDPANAILRCRLERLVTDEILKDFFRAGAALAVRTQPAVGIVDLSRVSLFEVSSQALREQSKVPPVLANPGLQRVVIAPSAATYGMMRMFELEGEDLRPNIHVVRTEQQAWAILGVSPSFVPLQTD